MDYTPCFKIIRNKYLPCYQDNPCINTLFIGESPPEPKTNNILCESLRFFYNKNTDLFKYTKDAFSLTFPKKQWENNDKFLDFFKQNGYYLIDLCDVPVNKKQKSNRQVYRKNGEVMLKDKIQKFRPKNIVVIMKGIQKNVDSVLAQIPSNNYSYDKNIIILPFPSCRFPEHHKKYIQKLSEFLKTHTPQ